MMIDPCPPLGVKVGTKWRKYMMYIMGLEPHENTRKGHVLMFACKKTTSKHMLSY